jgi:hypothetical protein
VSDPSAAGSQVSDAGRHGGRFGPLLSSGSAGRCAAGKTVPPACDCRIAGGGEPAQGRSEQDTATDSRPAGASRESVSEREVAARATAGLVDPPGSGAHVAESQCEPLELVRLEALPRDGVRWDPPASGDPERARATERTVTVEDEQGQRVVAHVSNGSRWSTRRTSWTLELVKPRQCSSGLLEGGGRRYLGGLSRQDARWQLYGPVTRPDA